MTEKEKMLKQMLHDANNLKSYQMIWLGQRIFVMTTASFAHLKSFCIVMRLSRVNYTSNFLKSFVLEIQGIYFIPHCIMA